MFVELNTLDLYIDSVNQIPQGVKLIIAEINFMESPMCQRIYVSEKRDERNFHPLFLQFFSFVDPKDETVWLLKAGNAVSMSYTFRFRLGFKEGIRRWFTDKSVSWQFGEYNVYNRPT